MVVLAVILMVGAWLLWPILLSLRIDGTTSMSWATVWIPLWIADAIGEREKTLTLLQVIRCDSRHGTIRDTEGLPPSLIVGACTYSNRFPLRYRTVILCVSGELGTHQGPLGVARRGVARSIPHADEGARAREVALACVVPGTSKRRFYIVVVVVIIFAASIIVRIAVDIGVAAVFVLLALRWLLTAFHVHTLN